MPRRGGRTRVRRAAPADPMNRYFVTGGTGVIGSALLPELLADPGTQVMLLLRASDDDAARQRLDELFDFWALGAQERDFRERVCVARGDATEDRFGLDDSAYEAVVSSTTHIVHAAGAVRMNLPIEQARLSAVGSAQQVVDLAWALQRKGLLRKVEFVSTVGVGTPAGRPRRLDRRTTRVPQHVRAGQGRSGTTRPRRGGSWPAADRAPAQHGGRRLSDRSNRSLPSLLPPVRVSHRPANARPVSATG